MVDAQQWLQEKYTDERKKNIANLNIGARGLEGNLKIEGFINLKRLDCSNNKLNALEIVTVLTWTKLIVIKTDSLK